MQKGWLYESLLKKEPSRNAIYFDLDRPHTAFQNNFKKQSKEPWIDPLIFKRWAYFGFIERNRKEKKKQTTQTKRIFTETKSTTPKKEINCMDDVVNYFLNFTWTIKLKKKKANRIKQILTKIYLPFYGNLNKNQLTALIKKK